MPPDRSRGDRTGFASASIKALTPHGLLRSALPDKIQQLQLKSRARPHLPRLHDAAAAAAAAEATSAAYPQSKLDIEAAELASSQYTRVPAGAAQKLHGEMLLAYIQEREADSCAGLEIINDVDDEACPQADWHWTSGYIVHPDVGPMQRPDDAEDEDMCCDCDEDECRPETCSCYRVHEKFAPVPWAISDGTESPLRGKFAYNQHGRLHHYDMPHVPIWECNSACKCASSCPNRVVQKGRRVWLQIVKTRETGWGIRAGEFIHAGTFVSIYSGELLSVAEEQRRSNFYEQTGMTYVLELDFYHIAMYLSRPYRRLLEKVQRRRRLQQERKNGRQDLSLEQAAERRHDHRARAQPSDAPTSSTTQSAPLDRPRSVEDDMSKVMKLSDEEIDAQLQLEGDDIWRQAQKVLGEARVPEMLCVDSALYGNLSRYFNHSCDPNMDGWPVYTTRVRDMRRPFYAFFTRRDVQPFEELTFSYSGTSSETAAATVSTAEGTSQQDAATKVEAARAEVQQKEMEFRKAIEERGGSDGQTMAGEARTTRAVPTPGPVQVAVGGGLVAHGCRCGAKNCQGFLFRTLSRAGGGGGGGGGSDDGVDEPTPKITDTSMA